MGLFKVFFPPFLGLIFRFFKKKNKLGFAWKKKVWKRKLWGLLCSRFCLFGEKILMKRKSYFDLFLGVNSIRASKRIGFRWGCVLTTA